MKHFKFLEQTPSVDTPSACSYHWAAIFYIGRCPMLRCVRLSAWGNRAIW